MTNYEVRQERRRLEDRVERVVKAVRARISKLQVKCEHIWEYQSDPSGNNDSGYSCVCGSWRKHL